MAKYFGTRGLSDAYKIARIGEASVFGMSLLLEDGTSVVASLIMVKRCKPEAGDYWVIQPDGFVHIARREIFERDYRLYTQERERK